MAAPPFSTGQLGILAPFIYPFKFQSGSISFGDWISLLTLGLAPLMVHVSAGAPEPSLLSPREPRWYDRLCHYNPTSIIWRYYAITDRRLRTRSWTAVNMAAANAVFWTPRGWDGSDEMVESSRHHLVRRPGSATVRPFSWSAGRTLVLTLQGAQALYGVIMGIPNHPMLAANISVSNIFAPIAVLGLLRLFAATWLTDDLSYFYRDWASASPVRPPGSLDLEKTEAPGCRKILSHVPTAARFLPVSGWRSRVLRAVYLLPILGLWAITVVHVFSCTTTATTSATIMAAFYLIVLTGTVGTYAFYFLLRERQCSSTVLPCISTIWYRAYSGVLGAGAIAMVIVSALETRATPCAKYTTFPDVPGVNEGICKGLITLNAGSQNSPFGLVTPYATNETAAALSGVRPDILRIMNASGVCIVEDAQIGSQEVVVVTNRTSI